MYKILFLILMVYPVFANNLIDLYRLKGLNAVEEKLEEGLRNIDYWNKYLENKNVDYGYYETKKYILLTQKEQKQLQLFEKIDDNFILLSKDSVIVGENEGDKFKQGDKKTPEGAYDLLKKKTNVDQFYGPFALVTSYPNTFDKTLKKNGYGIWIHGMPLNESRESYTQGCIALENLNLKDLEKKIDIKKAVLLTSNKEFKKASKTEIAIILSSIYKWKEYWKKSDLKNYLSFYSKDFIKADGSNLKKFSSLKEYIFKRKEQKRIKFSNINISPYPNSFNKNMYKVIMDEVYKSPAVDFKGEKELFIEIVDKKMKILAEG